jgi:hypothetical protein
VGAGNQLIGLALDTGGPFVQVTQNCLRHFVKGKVSVIAEQASELRTIQWEQFFLLNNAAVLEALIRRRVVTIQTTVHCWRARTLAYRTRKMQSVTQAQREQLMKTAMGWLERTHIYCIDDDSCNDYCSGYC